MNAAGWLALGLMAFGAAFFVLTATGLYVVKRYPDPLDLRRNRKRYTGTAGVSLFVAVVAAFVVLIATVAILRGA